MKCDNTKYVIKWDYDLNGQTITVPKNCILEFDGGTLKNGTIIGQDTVINNIGDLNNIFGRNLVKSGSWRDHFAREGGSENKPYNPESFSGMGRVCLNQNIINVGGVDKNVLTQNAFYKDGPNETRVPNTNTVFVVEYDFVITDDIEIPADSVLEFNGGSITGDGEHTLTLNGAKIVNNGDVIFRNVTITSDQGLELYTSWFEWTEENSEGQLVSLVGSVSNYGFLYVDTMITLAHPVEFPKATETVIAGAVPTRIAAQKFGIRFTYADDAPNGLIHWSQEACSFYNLGITQVVYAWNKQMPILCLDTVSDNAADLDFTIEKCQLITKSYYTLIIGHGRGFKMQDSLVHRSGDNGCTPTIVLEGKGNQDGMWLSSKIAGRGVIITNNRIHGNGNASILELKQHPNDTDWTYVNVQITNNHCDHGTRIFDSSSKVRGVLIDGNVIIKKSGYTSIIRISNSAEQLSFTNNIVNKNAYFDEIPGQDQNMHFIEIAMHNGMTVEGVRVCGNDINCKIDRLIRFTGTYSGDIPIKDIQINNNRIYIGIIIDSKVGNEPTDITIPVQNVQINDNKLNMALSGDWNLIKLDTNSKNITVLNNIINGGDTHQAFLIGVVNNENTGTLKDINVSGNIFNTCMNGILVLYHPDGTGHYPLCKQVIINNNIFGDDFFTSTGSTHNALIVAQNFDIDDVQIIGNISANDADCVFKFAGDSLGRSTTNMKILGNTGISKYVGGKSSETCVNIIFDYNYGETRPVLTNDKIGFPFFDTIIRRNIVYDGASWFNFDGSVANKVTLTLSHLTYSDSVLNTDNTYSVVFSADEEYTLPSTIIVTMGDATLVAGTDYTYDSTTGEISILGVGGSGGVTDDVEIRASGETV